VLVQVQRALALELVLAAERVGVGVPVLVRAAVVQ